MSHPHFIKKEGNNQCIKIQIKKLKVNFVKKIGASNLKKIIEYRDIIGTTALIIIPVLTGMFTYITNFSSANNTYMYTLIFSLEMTLIYTSIVRSDIIKNDNTVVNLYIFIGIVILIFISTNQKVYEFLDYILRYIINHLQESFGLLIAIIMLCIALSALSFGYCSIISKDDIKRKNMKKNGEGYFIASILSMFSIMLLFFISIIKPHVVFMTLVELNIFSHDFLLLNLYSLLLIIIITFIIYAIFCLIKCSIFSLIELGFFKRHV